MRNRLIIVLCLSALAGCASSSALLNRTANSTLPPEFEGQWQCPAPAATELPSDATLATWDGARTFVWGEASWKWGHSCAELMDYNRHYRACEKGDVAECTLTNQLYDKYKPQ